MHKQTTNMYLALSEIISLFRNKLKHEKLTDAEYDVIEKLSKELYILVISNKYARKIFMEYYNLDCPKLERKWKKEIYDYCINYEHPHTKINESEYLNIYKLYNIENKKQHEIAKIYNVHQMTISKILRSKVLEGIIKDNPNNVDIEESN
jgi:hypothetical protein